MINRQKIFFVQKINENEFEKESLWCIKRGDNYIIDNIPFIAKRISLGDTIKAEYDLEEGVYYFDDFVSVSGNSTVRLYFFKDVILIEDVRKYLNSLGCEGEIFLARKILAINVPSNIDYRVIKQYLDEGELQGKWQYEESCLAHEY
ncbi:DUF4265 domain-containing protein [Panacibacter sp. DH6]|uniref:DUF4265 domain-containing protein n=1 Tax=Panacibacter microcysteis TaxID=2793269 RepID=A0A931E001_9BACT|nr:DUF4265 domain-containing protein [Panacibacter microcysteis]MBG9376087.1 DUF4265 domain-containing protein [Panacibacter microcysteis]